LCAGCRNAAASKREHPRQRAHNSVHLFPPAAIGHRLALFRDYATRSVSRNADVAINRRYHSLADSANIWIDMARKTKRLFTIGYEQTPSKAVLDELENAGVKLLVDVRAVASSRRPGFPRISSQPASMSAALPICI
jgi:hypothetical protein